MYTPDHKLSFTGVTIFLFANSTMFVIPNVISPCFLILLFSIASIHSQQTLFNTFVFFGDSNTDTNNVYHLTNATWPPSPPYWQGRASDGPVWAEKLDVATSINYAYGGATSDNNLIHGYTGRFDNVSIPGVRQQIGTYQNQTNLTLVNFDRTLFFIWAGANDYYFNLTVSPEVVVRSLMTSVNDLIQLGVKHFFIMNQPPLESLPSAIALNSTAYIASLVLAHNMNLSRAIDSIQKNMPNVSFRLVDIYSVIKGVLNDGATYGINNTQICWHMTNVSFVQLCPSVNNSLYMDEFHFTSRAHQIIADHVRTLFGTSSGIRSTSSATFFLFSLLITFLFF